MSQSAAQKRFLTRAYAEYKRQAFEILGGAICARCGYSDARALSFDHIEGGGHAERKRRGNGIAMMRAVLREPQRFRVLCLNCNWIVYRERVPVQKPIPIIEQALPRGTVEAIIKLYTKRGLSQADIARRLKTTQATVSRKLIANGTQKFSRAVV
jgi:hypothetical protein